MGLWSREDSYKHNAGFEGYYDHRTGKHGVVKHKKKGRHTRRIGCLFLLVVLLALGAMGYSAKSGSILTDGDSPLVKTAAKQIGNHGGDPYWSWFGFEEEVDWCGCFVSWVANQNGYTDEGLVSTFSYCQDGINWFKEQNRYHIDHYAPKAGDIIFFDWNDNQVADHVGIVSGTGYGRVFTIEGNTGDDEVMRKGYWNFSNIIMGYGEVPSNE